jgi:hypothetical protein
VLGLRGVLPRCLFHDNDSGINAVLRKRAERRHEIKLAAAAARFMARNGNLHLPPLLDNGATRVRRSWKTWRIARRQA